MKRGTKRENLNIKLVKGNTRTPRDRATNFKEPSFDTTSPKMPAFVKKIPLAVSIWNEYMQMGMGKRILTEPDSRAFGLWCLMNAELEAQVDKFTRKRGDLTPSASWLAQYRMYAELFGLVPAGRTRIMEKPNADEETNKDKKDQSPEAQTKRRTAGYFED